VTRTVVAVTAAIAITACSSSSPDAQELAAEIDAVITSYQPQVDALVARVQAIKGKIVDKPGWQHAWRIAEAANDTAGLPPFTALAPPGPGRIIPPGFLIGIGPDVRKRTPKLVQANDTAQLARILVDIRFRYIREIVQVSNELDQVEYWIAHPGAAVAWHI